MCSERLAVVTGANKGLGLAIVRGLCEKFQGIVCLTSRDVSRGLQATKQLEEEGLKCDYHQLDVTDPESISKFTEYVRTQYGRIDVLVNNAGILFLKDATEPKAYQAEQTLAANFFALVQFTETVLPLVQNDGRIVNISSSSGHLSRIPSEDLRNELMKSDLSLDELNVLMAGYLESVRSGNDVNRWGDSPYVVSKVGVNAYTFILHRRLAAKGISVDCVHPGYVASDMTRGVGLVSPAQGAADALRLALCRDGGGGGYWWRGRRVPWGGPDPRGYIDGRDV